MKLEHLEKLEASATEGPWFFMRQSNGVAKIQTEDDYVMDGDTFPIIIRNCDGTLIAAFRNNAKALLAVVRAAKTLRDNTDECGDSSYEHRSGLYKALDKLEKVE